MTVENLGHIVGAHRLFAGLAPEFLELVTGCAMNVRFKAGEFLAREGQEFDQIYLIREGRVGLEISAPGKGRLTFMTAAANEVVGLSWLVPPYRWTYDVHAHSDIRAIAVDAACLRRKCEADPALGYAVMQRFMPVVVDRLHATRLQMLDVYGPNA